MLFPSSVWSHGSRGVVVFMVGGGNPQEQDNLRGEQQICLLLYIYYYSVCNI